MASSPKKATIYIEADDEITTVIDKMLSAAESIVAVVLPKRAAVFQSAVNMKLLKRAAEESKKKIVLISSEPAIESIAAVAGVHLAQSLTSKPAIPKKLKVVDTTTITPDELDDSPAVIESEAPASPEPAAEPAPDTDSDVIELDNTDDEAVSAESAAVAPTAKAKGKKRFKIPDFSSFQLRMALFIGLGVLLIGGWVLGFIIMPRATVTINTDTSNMTVNLDLTASTAAAELNTETGVIPAKKATVTKQSEATAPATGQKDVGEKATGSVTMSAQACDTIAVPRDVPAGTGVSSNGKTFITQDDIEFSFSSFNGTCLIFTGGETDIVAQASGDSYNLAEDSEFTVSGRADVSATGDASGGTTKMVTVVSEDDIKKAREQSSGTSSAEAVSELRSILVGQQQQALDETLVSGEPSVKTSVAAGAEAAEVKVTQTISYEMLGVASSDIAKALEAKITAQQEAEGQADKNLRSNGLDSAVYRLTNRKSNDEQIVTLQAVAVLGPTFDENELKTSVAGKRRGDIESLLRTRDGVQSVTVEYKPFWVTTTPKSASKIIIVINEAND